MSDTPLVSPIAALPDRRRVLTLMAGAAGLFVAPSASWARPATAPTAGLPPPRTRGERFRRGASLGLFIKGADAAYRRSSYGAFLDEMPFAGVTDVQLITRWQQVDVTSSTLAPGPETDDETLRWVIGAAHARGLRVFLMPIVHVRQRGKGEWRGTLEPADLDRWWAAYRHFVNHYADLAAAEGVELYAVGSELVSMERHVDRWRSLIADVRGRFSGRLTYSANWDHFEPVQFWDALDVAGLNGYHPLVDPSRPDVRPSEDALVEGWHGFVQRVRHWSHITGKPFILTEIGYPSTPFAAARPWDHETPGRADAEMQLRCYRAMYRAWHAESRLAGVYIWNWFGVGGADDTGYTPRGKPAMHVVDWWYGGSKPIAPPMTPKTGAERR